VLGAGTDLAQRKRELVVHGRPADETRVTRRPPEAIDQTGRCERAVSRA
jgi:hypothetical protein